MYSKVYFPYFVVFFFLGSGVGQINFIDDFDLSLEFYSNKYR